MSSGAADEIGQIIDAALREDLGGGDVTTDALVAEGAVCEARLVVREAGVVAGLEVARAVFGRVDPGLEWSGGAVDGDAVAAGSAVARVAGELGSILKAERTALNFMQRMSGIATLSARYVAAVAGTGAVIKDTRKTAPGLRVLDKRAVLLGGAENHRAGLFDGVLVKDNHIRALAEREGLTLKQVVGRARRGAPRGMRVEIEVTTAEMASEAAEAGADVVMLDNMGAAEMGRAVEAVGGRCVVEASGGITLGNVRAAAEAGVDWISVGELTHSVHALDMALEVGEPG